MKKIKPKHISQANWEAVESPDLSESLLTAMRPVREAHPEIPARVRGPQKTPIKIPISLRLDESIVQALRATGRGWQGRVNDILRDWLAGHRAA